MLSKSRPTKRKRSKKATQEKHNTHPNISLTVSTQYSSYFEE
jgi:hypothetical protein